MKPLSEGGEGKYLDASIVLQIVAADPSDAEFAFYVMPFFTGEFRVFPAD